MASISTRPIPEPAVVLDLRGVLATLVAVDGEPVVEVSDGDSTVHLSGGMGALSLEAALGVHRVIVALNDLAGRLPALGDPPDPQASPPRRSRWPLQNEPGS